MGDPVELRVHGLSFSLLVLSFRATRLWGLQITIRARLRSRGASDGRLSFDSWEGTGVCAAT